MKEVKLIITLALVNQKIIMEKTNIHKLILVTLAVISLLFTVYLILNKLRSNIKEYGYLEAINKITSDCETYNITPQNSSTPHRFRGNYNDVQYILGIAQSLDPNVTYQPNLEIYSTKADNKLYISAFNNKPGSKPISVQYVSGEHCWVVWSENSEKKGKLAYFDKNHRIQILYVNNFLYIIPPKTSTF